MEITSGRLRHDPEHLECSSERCHLWVGRNQMIPIISSYRRFDDMLLASQRCLLKLERETFVHIQRDQKRTENIKYIEAGYPPHPVYFSSSWL